MAIAHRLSQQLTGFMPRRNIAVPTLCVVVLVAVWSFRLPHPSLGWLGTAAGPSADTLPSLPGGPPRHGNEIDLSDPAAPFVGWPLARVCNETQWQEGLVFICDNNSGGIGNVRNYIQTCLRYALDAGATALVVPRIRKRSDKDLADLFADYLPFSYMFDEPHFRAVFNAHCPQITLYNDTADVPGAVAAPGEKPNVELVVPKEFGNREGCDWKDQNRHTDRFHNTFNRWLYNVTNGAPPSRERPRLIRFKWGVLWDWPVYRDGPEFAATFGSVLRFNEQLQRLGRVALERMRALAAARGAEHGDFLGVHLRSESDAMGFWPTYEAQAAGYLKQAQQRHFTAAYLATGNATEAAKFAQAADAAASMQVVTKADLLVGADLDELNGLTWDQQGVVDFIVLLGSRYFVGVMPSSFSVYMAMKRHLRTDGLYTRPYRVGTEGDGLSWLVGRYDNYWEDWLFMWDGMWP